MSKEKNDRVVKLSGELHETVRITVKSLRRLRGLSQGEAAARAGIHRIRWLDLENGRSRPSFEKLAQAATALGCEVRHLLDPELASLLASLANAQRPDSDGPPQDTQVDGGTLTKPERLIDP